MNKLVSLLLLSFSSSAFAQEKLPEVGKHVAGNMNAMSMILSLLMVLVLIVVMAVIFKRLQPAIKQAQGLKIVTSLHLGTKERLVVVEVGEQQMLLGVTAGQISLIETLPEKLNVAAPLGTDLGQSVMSLLKGGQGNKTQQASHSDNTSQFSANTSTKES